LTSLLQPETTAPQNASQAAQTKEETMDFLTLLSMHDPGDGPDGWWIFPIFWLVVWVGVIATAIRFFAGRRRDWRHHSSAGRAGDILAERFARGELSNDEYTERLRQLRAAERVSKEDKDR
jgi:putative membrane protein